MSDTRCCVPWRLTLRVLQVGSLMYISHSRQLQSVLTSDNVKCVSLLLQQFPFHLQKFLTQRSLYIRDERPNGIQKYDLRYRSCCIVLPRCSCGCRTAHFSRSHAASDYAKFDEIVQMSYVYTHPRVQEWQALGTWQVRDNYAGE